MFDGSIDLTISLLREQAEGEVGHARGTTLFRLFSYLRQVGLDELAAAELRRAAEEGNTDAMLWQFLGALNNAEEGTSLSHAIGKLEQAAVERVGEASLIIGVLSLRGFPPFVQAEAGRAKAWLASAMQNSHLIHPDTPFFLAESMVVEVVAVLQQMEEEKGEEEEVEEEEGERREKGSGGEGENTLGLPTLDEVKRREAILKQQALLSTISHCFRLVLDAHSRGSVWGSLALSILHLPACDAVRLHHMLECLHPSSPHPLPAELKHAVSTTMLQCSREQLYHLWLPLRPWLVVAGRGWSHFDEGGGGGGEEGEAYPAVREVGRALAFLQSALGKARPIAPSTSLTPGRPSSPFSSTYVRGRGSSSGEGSGGVINLILRKLYGSWQGGDDVLPSLLILALVGGEGGEGGEEKERGGGEKKEEGEGEEGKEGGGQGWARSIAAFVTVSVIASAVSAVGRRHAHTCESRVAEVGEVEEGEEDGDESEEGSVGYAVQARHSRSSSRDSDALHLVEGRRGEERGRSHAGLPPSRSPTPVSPPRGYLSPTTTTSSTTAADVRGGGGGGREWSEASAESPVCPTPSLVPLPPLPALNSGGGQPGSAHNRVESESLPSTRYEDRVEAPAVSAQMFLPSSSPSPTHSLTPKREGGRGGSPLSPMAVWEREGRVLERYVKAASARLEWAHIKASAHMMGEELKQQAKTRRSRIMSEKLPPTLAPSSTQPAGRERRKKVTSARVSKRPQSVTLARRLHSAQPGSRSSAPYPLPSRPTTSTSTSTSTSARSGRKGKGKEGSASITPDTTATASRPSSQSHGRDASAASSLYPSRLSTYTPTDEVEDVFERGMREAVQYIIEEGGEGTAVRVSTPTQVRRLKNDENERIRDSLRQQEWEYERRRAIASAMEEEGGIDEVEEEERAAGVDEIHPPRATTSIGMRASAVPYPVRPNTAAGLPSRHAAVEKEEGENNLPPRLSPTSRHVRGGGHSRASSESGNKTPSRSPSRRPTPSYSPMSAMSVTPPLSPHSATSPVEEVYVDDGMIEVVTEVGSAEAIERGNASADGGEAMEERAGQTKRRARSRRRGGRKVSEKETVKKGRGQRRSRSKSPPMISPLIPPQPPPFYRPSSAAFVRRRYHSELKANVFGGEAEAEAEAMARMRGGGEGQKGKKGRGKTKARAVSAKQRRPPHSGRAKSKSTARRASPTPARTRQGGGGGGRGSSDPLRRLIDEEMERRFPDAVKGLRQAVANGMLYIDSPSSTSRLSARSVPTTIPTGYAAAGSSERGGGSAARRRIDEAKREGKMQAMMEELRAEARELGLELPPYRGGGADAQQRGGGGGDACNDEGGDRSGGRGGSKRPLTVYTTKRAGEDGREVKWVSSPPAEFDPPFLRDDTSPTRGGQARTHVVPDRPLSVTLAPLPAQLGSTSHTLGMPLPSSWLDEAEQREGEEGESGREEGYGHEEGYGGSVSGREGERVQSKSKLKAGSVNARQKQSRLAQRGSPPSHTAVAPHPLAGVKFGEGRMEAAKRIADPSTPLSVSPRSRPSSLRSIEVGEGQRGREDDLFEAALMHKYDLTSPAHPSRGVASTSSSPSPSAEVVREGGGGEAESPSSSPPPGRSVGWTGAHSRKPSPSTSASVQTGQKRAKRKSKMEFITGAYTLDLEHLPTLKGAVEDDDGRGILLPVDTTLPALFDLLSSASVSPTDSADIVAGAKKSKSGLAAAIAIAKEYRLCLEQVKNVWKRIVARKGKGKSTAEDVSTAQRLSRELMSALKRWRKSPLSERVLHLRYEDDDVERGAKEEAERVAGLVATADSKKSAAKRRASMWA